MQASSSVRSRVLPSIAIVAVVLATAGCVSEPVQPYQPSFENVQLLKRQAPRTNGVELGVFSGGPTRLNVRGSSALSPVGSGFADYLRGALEAELAKAEMLRPGGGARVTGTIIGTDIETGTGSTARAWLDAEIVVSGSAGERYRRQLRVEHQWESSFVGAIAIPLAFQAYPQLVQRFLQELYADPAFGKALQG